MNGVTLRGMRWAPPDRHQDGTVDMRRISKAALAALLVLPLAGGVAAAAVIPPGTNGPGLASVGPVSATDGFPVWYKDKVGLRLEPCIVAADPLCPARGPLPDETAPLVFPTNYPDEGFYQLASATLTTANGGKAVVEGNMEAAFANGGVIDGDQITFARTRVRITNATDGVDYKITSPNGVQTVQTTKPGLIFVTEDIGVGAKGDFSGALGGRLGPFLTWDTYPTDPALKPNAAGKDTYVGDGATPHKVIGSPYGTNFVRIEAPGVNPTPLVDACPTLAGNALADCIETDLLTLQGKLATTSGVTAERATYSTSSAGSGLIDVFASSEPDGPQSIQVTDPSATPEFAITGLTGSTASAGHYFARVPYTGTQPPTTVRVSNIGDVPVTNKNITVVDRVSGTAVYTTGAPGTPGSLKIDAVSSDTVTSPVLTASGFGPADVVLASGSLTIAALDAPPVSVTVTSAVGGTVKLPVEIAGAGATPVPVVAMAGPNQTAITGQTVTLDGTASSGAISTFSWSSPAGITLANPTSPRSSFTAPAAGVYTFTLTVTGSGPASSASMTVTVSPAATPVADAGPAQTVQRSSTVTLDGSASTSAATYAWTQIAAVGDPTAVLTGANTAKPTFTFPAYKSPANNGPLTFQLVVGNTSGPSAPARVTITPTTDSVAITVAQYTRNRSLWRVDGTSTILAGQAVVVHLGPLTGPVLGTTAVDAVGAFSMRGTPGIVGRSGQTVSIESALGGTAAGFPVRIR